MQYLDSDWDFTGQSAHLSDSDAASYGYWLHQPSPHTSWRIYSPTFTGGYLMNQGNPDTRAFFRNFALKHYNPDNGLLMDWQSASLSQELYYSTCGCTHTAEIKSNKQLQALHADMASALTHRNGAPFLQVDNTLPANPYLPQGLNMLNPRNGVEGWAVEGEPMDDGSFDPFYSTLLDQMAWIGHYTNGFIVPMSVAPSGSFYQAQSRRVQEGTIMLGYSAGHVVDWAALEQGSSDLEIWPEEGIYPTNSVESMAAPRGRGCLAGTGHLCSKGGHNSLRVTGGVYRREFGRCYDNGRRFGACATIVNSTGHSVRIKKRWLHLHYRYQITFAGGDVQSHGRVNLRGARFRAGSTRVAPHDAILLSY
jgi:hypothetical protein